MTSRRSPGTQPFVVLALSGSLRKQSLNSQALRLAGRLAPAELSIRPFWGLGDLPLFNPDDESDPPPPVITFRRAVDASDALLIASPEYAHGISGVMKNALDWMVGHEGFYLKPVAVLNASPRAHHALDALQEVLKTMSANVVRDACQPVPLLGSQLDEELMIADEQIAGPLRTSLQALLSALREWRASGVD